QELATDQPLPTQKELCELYGVSRITVRQALLQLIADGLVRRRRSRGRLYFQPRVHQRLTRLRGFFADDLLAAGLHSRTRVCSVHRVTDAHAAEMLRVGEADELFRVERLHEADGAPTATQVSYVPVAIDAGLDRRDLSQSLFTLLEQVTGESITHAVQHVSVRRASTEETFVLHSGRYDPVIQVERVSFSASDRALEYFSCTLPAALYDFVMELDLKDGSPQGTAEVLESPMEQRSLDGWAARTAQTKGRNVGRERTGQRVGRGGQRAGRDGHRVSRANQAGER
ncbi:MAG: GntR family transcriptional regulator, partial [Acidimicrobiales bacterium]